MRLPKMKYTENRQQKTVVQFMGVNYGENTADGQFAETENLSARMFPCLSQRQGRSAVMDTYQNPTAVWYKNGLVVVDGTDLKHNGVVVGTVSPGKKQFANVNTKVVIMPDKVMYDTESKEFRSLEAEFISEAGAVEFVGGNKLKVHMGAYRGEQVGSGVTTQYRTSVTDNLDNGEVTYTDVKVFDARLTGLTVNEENGTLTVAGREENLVAKDWAVGDLFSDATLGMDGVKSWGKIVGIKREEVEDRVAVRPGGELMWWNTVEYRFFEYVRYEVKGTSYEGFGGWEGANFRAGDTVEISGATTYEANNKTATVRSFASH